jgi:hypothetical protein
MNEVESSEQKRENVKMSENIVSVELTGSPVFEMLAQSVKAAMRVLFSRPIE